MNTRTYGRLARIKRTLALGAAGVLLASPFTSCDLGQFTTTSTVTLDGREVVSFLVRSWILTPIENAVDEGINRFFDQFDHKN